MHEFLVYLPFDPNFLTGASWRSGVNWHKLVQWSEQPRSQGFNVRTRRDTKKSWSGPVNFAF
jgi:hypothetical protein